MQAAAAANRNSGSSVVAGGRASLLTRKEVIKQGNGPRVTKVIWLCVKAVRAVGGYVSAGGLWREGVGRGGV